MFELSMDRQFEVPVEKLFEAWCNPELIQKWFAPGNMTVPHADTDLREGGRYRIVMHDAEHQSNHIVGGTYQHIINNKLLVFTWQWEGNPIATKVQVAFAKVDDNSSRLTLTHTEFGDQESCDKHEMGWNGCLENLNKITK